MKKLMGEFGPADPQVGFIDGYHMGERLLEGVLFRIEPSLDNSTLVCMNYEPEFADYMKKFSKEQIQKWCDQAAAIALRDECQNRDNTEDLYFMEESDATT